MSGSVYRNFSDYSVIGCVLQVTVDTVCAVRTETALLLVAGLFLLARPKGQQQQQSSGGASNTLAPPPNNNELPSDYADYIPRPDEIFARVNEFAGMFA